LLWVAENHRLILIGRPYQTIFEVRHVRNAGEIVQPYNFLYLQDYQPEFFLADFEADQVRDVAACALLPWTTCPSSGITCPISS